MKSSSHQGDVVPRSRAARLVLLSLLLLLPLFPPETWGESMAGCAVLIATLALLLWRCAAQRWEAWALFLVAAVAWPLSLAAAAPGATVEPLAVALLAGAAGVYVSTLPPGLRQGFPLTLTVAGAGALVSLRALYQKSVGLETSAQILSGMALPDQAAALERLREGRAFANFATPAALGGFLALAIPVTVGLALSRRGWTRWALLAVAVLQLGGLLAAASATAVAALLLALLLSALVWGPRRRLTWLAGGLAVLGLLLAVVLMRGQVVWDPSDPNSPWRLRAGNFRLAWTMFRDHPWLGVGPGGFGEMYPLYRLPGDNEAQHAHNLPLEIAAEMGVVGLLVIGGLFFFLFLGPLFRRGQRDPPWLRGLCIGLASFAFHNLGDFTAFFPSLLWLAALLRGMASRAEARGSTPTRPAGRLLAAAALLATLAAALVAGLSGIAANSRMLARQAAAEEERELAVELAERGTRLAPWETDGWLFRAQAVLHQPRQLSSPKARLEQALGHVERAVRLSPVRPGARWLRGRLRRALGDLPGAYADLAQAARLYPLKTLYSKERDTLAGELRILRQGQERR